MTWLLQLVPSGKATYWNPIVFLTLCLFLAPEAQAECVTRDGVRQPTEECDGSDLGPYTCEHFCAEGGLLRCTSDCTFDFAGCQVCGDGEIQSPEVCDCGTDGTCNSTELGGAGCAFGGNLGCQEHCRDFDHSDCYRCLDGVINTPLEQCDTDGVGIDFGGAFCGEPGHESEHGGELACNACIIDRSGCWICGDGQLQGAERCDDGNQTPGDGCTAQCQTECGDGTQNTAFEECDDGNRIDGDGCSSFCTFEAYYGGGGDEFSDCNLEWTVLGAETGSTTDCADGQGCDWDQIPQQCTFNVVFCFQVPSQVVAGPPPCIPDDITEVALVEPSVSGLGADDQDRFLAAAQAALEANGPNVTRTDLVLSVSPALTNPRACGSVFIEVPADEQRELAVRTSGPSFEPDVDQLILNCEP